MFEKINSIKEAETILSTLSLSNDERFLLSKTCEELTELQEVLLKMINKVDPHKPSKERLIEEIGDVMLRLQMIRTRFELSDKDIKNRIIYKCNKFVNYLNEGKYKNNV